MTDFYAKVEDGKIVRAEVSAKNARIGLLNFPPNATDDDFREYGWYPITGTRPVAEENQVVTGPTRTIDESTKTVVRNYTVRDKTQAELDAELAAWRGSLKISPRQARLMLLSQDLLETLETELAKPENKAAQISWEYATIIERSSDLISVFGPVLNLTEDEIDQLFMEASKL